MQSYMNSNSNARKMQALIIRVVHGYTLFVTNSHGIFKSYKVSVRI